MLIQFDEKKPNLKHVLQKLVASKPWFICSKVNQKRSSSNSMFRNNLQLNFPVPGTTAVPPESLLCIVDAMRMVRMTSITNLTLPIFLGCRKPLYNFMKQLPGTVLHIVFDAHEEDGHLNSLSRE